MTPKELEQTIRLLLQRPAADVDLREQLEQLAAAEISFSGLTCLASTNDSIPPPALSPYELS